MGNLSTGYLAKNYGPNVLAGDTERMYAMLSQSPWFQDLLRSSAIQGQMATTGVNQALSRAGLTDFGTGAIQRGVGGALTGQAQSGLRGGLWNMAGQNALQSLLARLQAYSQGASQPSFLQNLTGSLIGAGGFAAGSHLGKGK